MIDRFKALKNLDRKRLDAALMRIHGRPLLMVFFNLILLGINSLGRLKQLAKSALSWAGWNRLPAGTADRPSQLRPQPFAGRVFNRDSSVLIVCETSIAQCLRYRVAQKIEQLKILNKRCGWVDWTDYMQVSNQITVHDIIIFYRVPAYPKMLENIEYARRLGKVVIYDTDDLIFDRQILQSHYSKGSALLSKKQLKGVFKGADLYKKAISQCDYALTTTPVLKKQLEKMLAQGRVYILPNALDQHSQAASQYSIVKRPGRLNLFYGSGTRTHDEDFALIAGPLSQILQDYKQVDLIIAGYLTLPDVLQAFRSRITQIGFLELAEYLYLLRHADINLAPLKSGLFADCKSEIKWLESAALGIPTVASATSVYAEAINHGHDGYVADSPAQWLECLRSLIENKSLRLAMGEAAANTARTDYNLPAIAQKLDQILRDIKNDHISRQGFEILADERKHILLVNVLYPPKAMGGATVVVEHIVKQFKAQYQDRFHISVFTCDVDNIYAYQLSEYEYDGVTVSAVSVPVGPDVEQRGFDDNIGQLFVELLDYKQPDLIHFHCIQRLTASTLQVALQRRIPVIVSVHDAWWLSDHQFLIDEQGKAVEALPVNPVIASKSSDDLQQTLSRTRRLGAILNQADCVLAVSDSERRCANRLSC